MSNLNRRKVRIKMCPYCGTKLSYASILGKYSCKNCGFSELDLYGQMKELLEDTPSLSKIELSLILNVPIREINQFIDDGVLNNPFHDIP